MFTLIYGKFVQDTVYQILSELAEFYIRLLFLRDTMYIWPVIVMYEPNKFLQSLLVGTRCVLLRVINMLNDNYDVIDHDHVLLSCTDLCDIQTRIKYDHQGPVEGASAYTVARSRC